MICCQYPDNKVTLYYVHNKILLDFHIKSEDKESKIEAKLLLEPSTTSIRDLRIKQENFPKMLA